MPAPEFTPTPATQPAEIRLVPNRTYQAIDGFGGCFNELSWIALNKLSQRERDRALQSLFSADGCAFNLARLPIGASDYAESAYSLDDTPGDLELKDYSIDRDRKCLLPYVKAAMVISPGLRCWGSPWSPPAWMKTSNHYSRGSLKWEPPILRAYAVYLARWVESYRAEGVNIYALVPQNEPNILNVYPTCEWSGLQLREFIADYLGPTLQERKVDVELWLGLNGDPPGSGDNANDRLATLLDDPKASAFLTGIAFQYDSKTQIHVAGELYPDKKLMQSETECNGGNNSWADAMKLYQLMKRYINNGASSYFAWNMVLDETGMSTWKWKQNALITADVSKQELRFNGEFYVMRHFSQFVKPGAKRALTSGPWGDQIGFVNPDGSAVLVVGNSQKKPLPARIALAGREPGRSLEVTVPAESISTFVIPEK
ncbi:MAG TPA: glycoside hydrolase family 30 beta sandwich domain-containing protein [Tepidisphaeraceae bacterium]